MGHWSPETRISPVLSFSLILWLQQNQHSTRKWRKKRITRGRTSPPLQDTGDSPCVRGGSRDLSWRYVREGGWATAQQEQSSRELALWGSWYHLIGHSRHPFESTKATVNGINKEGWQLTMSKIMTTLSSDPAMRRSSSPGTIWRSMLNTRCLRLCLNPIEIKHWIKKPVKDLLSGKWLLRFIC